MMIIICAVKGSLFWTFVKSVENITNYKNIKEGLKHEILPFKLRKMKKILDKINAYNPLVYWKRNF